MKKALPLPKLALRLLSPAQSPLPRWARRIAFHLAGREARARGCVCTFEDCEYFEWQPSHPTEGCPLRVVCAPTPPCGGCDRCIGEQVCYYREKERLRALGK